MSHLAIIILCVGSVVGNVTHTSSMSSGESEDGMELVSRGNVTLPSAVPWHASIYEVNGPVYKQHCGGTLIAPNLVVTAAHCFWDHGMNAPLENLHTYKVALGKIYREWYLDTLNPFVQRMDITRVILEPRLDGYVRRQLAYDIALVHLSMNATMSEYVQLASVDCTPWVPANGSIGVVAGWGLTENGTVSDVLRSIELPYIDHDTCYASLKEDRFRRLLTMDKFCAGYINQSKSVCQGDSGGGFVVIDEATNTTTLRGIVSLDFRPREISRSLCYNQHYTGFTNLGEARYIQWLARHLPQASSQVPVRLLLRADWSARPAKEASDPIQLPVPYIIFAHTAGRSCSDKVTCIQIIQGIQTSHMDRNGWSDIGYNFLIGGDGNAYMGHGWEAIGAHTYGYNRCSLGLAFIGTFTTEHPPRKQMKAARLLIAEGVRLGKISPNYRLLGHRQVISVESPGETLFNDMKKLPHFSEDTILPCDSILRG